VSATEDEHPVETLSPDGADEAFCIGIRLRRTHGRADDSNAFAAEYLVEGTRELAVAIVDQDAVPLKQAGEAKVAGLLENPRTGGLRRAPGEMDAPTADFDEE
jgi:hypothetical protein